MQGKAPRFDQSLNRELAVSTLEKSSAITLMYFYELKHMTFINGATAIKDAHNYPVILRGDAESELNEAVKNFNEMIRARTNRMGAGQRMMKKMKEKAKKGYND